ncbi:M15 family metallopeptidase [Leptolyngbya sp. AN02str]|uniref:M15 family metallopeptidase n=1 Tax=Leptolyngbya sp. AN02str TaxID=3423363 RepID=UPI003D31BE7E
MSDTNLSKETTPISTQTFDDIPVARREHDDSETMQRRNRAKRRYWLWGTIGFAIAILVGAFTSFLQPTLSSTDAVTPATTGLQSAVTWSTPNAPAETLLNHYPYDEAAVSSLKSVVADGSIRLRATAADKYLEMAEAARRDGVRLSALSGFRTLQEQNSLFFDVKAERGQRPTERATVSAPPGYSEHHTGYAIDIGDATRSATHLEITFESTPAFRWLQRNAARFGFEMSFPKDNPQNVSYEPWHWRFVGDRDSLETFYKARQSAP